MSQFDSLFKTDINSKAETKRVAKPKSKTAKRKTDASLSSTLNKMPSPSAKASPAMKSEKRTSGKSSNPDYTQALAYVKKMTLKNVKRELLDEPDIDFSELVERLLNEWLKSKR